MCETNEELVYFCCHFQLMGVNSFFTRSSVQIHYSPVLFYVVYFLFHTISRTLLIIRAFYSS